MSDIPRGPIGFRLAHELDGLLEGIRADGVIVREEQERAKRWLEDNTPFRDVRPFSELADHLERALSDGHLSPDECDDLRFVVAKLTTVNPYFDAMRAGLQTLMGLLAGVTADHVLTPEEIDALSDWTESWSHLKGLWPYDECDAIVTAMIARGRAHEETRYLFALADQFPVAGVVTSEGEVPPLLIGAICASCPEIRFDGRTFVVTGESHRAGRTDIERVVIERGGQWHEGVRRDSHYLVVCDGGCPHWAFACYGRKVEKAYDLRRKGFPITIVHESDFWDALA